MAWDSADDWAALAANMATAPPPVPQPGAPQGVQTNPAAEDPTVSTALFKQLASALEQSGLGSLFTLLPDGMPDTNSWLWKELVNNPSETTLESIGPALESTDVYKARFKTIFDIRKHNLDNPQDQRYVPTAGQVLQFEDQVRVDLRNAGVPQSMMTNDYIGSLMTKGLSAPEIQARLGQAYTRVADTDPAVRQAYEQFYGVVDGPGALAASFLDPTHMMSNLDKHSIAAYTAGIGRTMGMNVGQSMAEKIANQGSLTEGGIRQGLDQVSSMSGVFNEGITETKDLSTDTGLQNIFLGDAQAKSDIERRVLERQANARAVVGGALSTNAGLTGVGSS